jgi:hypothetical protein
MTSNRSIFHVSQLLLAFQLFIAFQTSILPVTARNIKSTVSKSNQSEILVIMASGINVTTIYNSFSEFKKMFGVEFPDDRRIAFKNGEGKFHTKYQIYRDDGWSLGAHLHVPRTQSKPFPSFLRRTLKQRGSWNCKITQLFMNPFLFHDAFQVTFAYWHVAS